MRDDYFKQERLFQKTGTVSSLSLRERTAEQALHSLISHLCSGVMSALFNKSYLGKKLRQWTSNTAKPLLLSQDLVWSNLAIFAWDKTPTWCGWHLPQVAFPNGSEGETKPGALHCFYHYPCHLWTPRLLCFPLGMCPQLHIIKSPPWWTLW